MKIITANLLLDGRVAYLASDDTWATDIKSAVVFDNGMAEEAITAAQLRNREVADIYLMDANEDASPAGRAALREIIRSAGPTVREDLGKQAGNA